jgi:L-alanine-DL-glutamate epimerase-like enolase superfamily enzyme
LGFGEGAGVFYLGDTAEGALTQIEDRRRAIEAGIEREALPDLLPPGCARNALDCALWDLQSKRSGRSAFELAGITPRSVEVQCSLGIQETPEEMASSAAQARGFRRIKIKLDAHMPLERVRAVRAARPDARLVVDANQAWDLPTLQQLAPELAALGIELIEQPLPRGQDDGLAQWRSPVPLCADESCQDIGELGVAARRYQLINVKLDKTGGLTSALALARAAHARGLGVMVGCMGGTSLAMAPALVLACECEIADLDGPLWLRADRLPSLTYANGWLTGSAGHIWG